MPSAINQGAGNCMCGPVANCSPCHIPEKNLTLSYVNTVLGNGTATLVYSSSPQEWKSVCTRGLVFRLRCFGGSVELSAFYFAGACRTDLVGSSNCSHPGGGGGTNQLNRTLATCSPFLLRYAVTAPGCSVLAGQGFTTFTVTE